MDFKFGRILCYNVSHARHLSDFCDCFPTSPFGEPRALPLSYPGDMVGVTYLIFFLIWVGVGWFSVFVLYGGGRFAGSRVAYKHNIHTRLEVSG
jgi:hypothetical protein